MSRRSWLRMGPAVAGVLVGGILGLAGCEQGRRALRTGPDPSVPTELGPVDDLDTVVRSGGEIELPGDDPQSFFKPGRLSGAWSREAADIEASLGVPR